MTLKLNDEIISLVEGPVERADPSVNWEVEGSLSAALTLSIDGGATWSAAWDGTTVTLGGGDILVSGQIVGIGAVSGGARLEVVDSGIAGSTVFKVTQDDQNPYGVVVGNDSFSVSDAEGLALYVTDVGISKIRALGTGGVLQFGTPANSSYMQLDNSGMLSLGDISNSGMTTGLTINQGAYDNEILALKSSDVAHGLTSAAETDTWYKIAKNDAALGGAWIEAIAEDAATIVVLEHYATGGTASTAKTTSSLGLIDYLAREHDGADAIANVTANGNVFTVRARVGGANATRFLIDEDGDMYSVTAGQTFDDYDDIALIETYDAVRSGSLKGQIKADFGAVMLMDESTLIDAGVLGDTISNGGLTNQTQLTRVLTGGIRQLSKNHMNLAARVDSLTLELTEANKQLAALSAPESD